MPKHPINRLQFAVLGQPFQSLESVAQKLRTGPKAAGVGPGANGAGLGVVEFSLEIPWPNWGFHDLEIPRRIWSPDLVPGPGRPGN